MINPVGIILVFIVVISLSSCVEPKALYVHLPDKVNCPGFKEAGEAKAEISVQPIENSTRGVPVIYNCNLAYAPINHLGIIASYQGAYNLKLSNDYGGLGFFGNTATEKFQLSSSMVDLSIGYFTKDGNKGLLECYGGFGIGYIRNNAMGYDDPGDYYGNFYRIFLQLDYCYSYKNALLIAGFRTMDKKYTAFDIGSNAEIDSSAIKQIKSNNLLLLQPFIEFQTGNRFIRFSMQFGCQIYLQGFNSSAAAGDQYNLNSGYRFNPSLLYLGLGISFHSAPRFGKVGFGRSIGEKKSDYW